jgi:uncharacterized membrane protein
MAFALEHFFCCLELKLGGIIMAWWGMILSAISIVGAVLALIGGGGYTNYLPLHVITNNQLISVILTILILVVYFYFSYQLLLASQNVSFFSTQRVEHVSIFKLKYCCKHFHILFI